MMKYSDDDSGEENIWNIFMIQISALKLGNDFGRNTEIKKKKIWSAAVAPARAGTRDWTRDL